MTLLHEPFKKHLGWNKRLFTFPFKNDTQIIKYCNHIYTNNSENQSIFAFIIFGIRFSTSTYSSYLEPGDFILAWTDKLTIQYVSYQYSTNAIEIYILILRDLYTIWKIPSQTEKINHFTIFE